VQILIGVGSVYVSLAVFSLMFTAAFDREIEDLIDQNKINCIVDRSTFIEMVKIYGGNGYDNYYAKVAKNGDVYLWSFETMSFQDK
jgi:hypothetical protein